MVAAGKGSRLRMEEGLPKPLAPLVGVPLISRVMWGAARAGIKRFKVVAGYRADVMRRELARLVPGGAVLEVIENPDFEGPNGVSLRMAAEALIGSGPFVLLMSDHIFSPERLKSALEWFRQTGRSLLVTEALGRFQGDIADATLVRIKGDRIEAIGKGLESPDAIDTGMFILRPEEAAEALRRAGPAPSISDGMRVLAAQGRLDAFTMESGWWQDVDTPEDFKEAERKLYASLRKPGDGVLAKLINRRVSVFLTKRLWPLGVTPNMVTAFTSLFGIAAGIFFAQGGAAWGLAGATAFQFQSIIDGVDGELARLLQKESRSGFWFDVIADNITHGMVFGGIAIGRIAEGRPGPWALLGVISCLGVAASFFAFAPLLDPSRANDSSRTRLGRVVAKLGSRDFSYLLFPLAALGWLGEFLWVATFGIWGYAAAAVLLRSRTRAQGR
ncbi:MAG: NTP transferase domain-containing protein [Deltaproteobacteria bacterium]|nr:NTP transferase domain-containing protein [Deltaproteobacteria bacterium]